MHDVQAAAHAVTVLFANSPACAQAVMPGSQRRIQHEIRAIQRRAPVVCFFDFQVAADFASETLSQAESGLQPRRVYVHQADNSAFERRRQANIPDERQ
jgi:hypothetical protein